MHKSLIVRVVRIAQIIVYKMYYKRNLWVSTGNRRHLTVND